jgi:hypothetical protein
MSSLTGAKAATKHPSAINLRDFIGLDMNQPFLNFFKLGMKDAADFSNSKSGPDGFKIIAI